MFNGVLAALLGGKSTAAKCVVNTTPPWPVVPGTTVDNCSARVPYRIPSRTYTGDFVLEAEGEGAQCGVCWC